VELKPGFTPGVPRLDKCDSGNLNAKGGFRGGILIPPRLYG
jgi:hypothetical protein